MRPRLNGRGYNDGRGDNDGRGYIDARVAAPVEARGDYHVTRRAVVLPTAS